MLIPELNIDEELILKPYAEAHHLKTIEWLNSDWLKESFGTHTEISLEKHQQWLKNNSDILIWTINSNANYIGNILLNPNHKNLSAYMQIYIGSSDSLQKA